MRASKGVKGGVGEGGTREKGEVYVRGIRRWTEDGFWRTFGLAVSTEFSDGGF
jgi:hypothetical protein